MTGKKVCTKCGEERLLKLFQWRVRYSCYASWCRICTSIAGKHSPSATYGTLAHFKCSRWSAINSRTVNGRYPSRNTPAAARYLEAGTRLEMTKEEFHAWCDEHWEEIREIYDMGGTPSVDRKQSDGHYSVGNLQVRSHSDNSRDGARRRNAEHRRPVVGTHLKTGATLRFESAHAVIAAGFSQSAVHGCLTGKCKKHKGYSWTYDARRSL